MRGKRRVRVVRVKMRVASVMLCFTKVVDYDLLDAVVRSVCVFVRHANALKYMLRTAQVDISGTNLQMARGVHAARR